MGSEDSVTPSHQSRISKINMPDSYISETEMKFKGTEGFDESVESVEIDLPDSLRLLRRIRAVSALSNSILFWSLPF